MSNLILSTERLWLRTWDDARFAEFLRVTNTPAVMRWLGGAMDDQHAQGLREELDALQSAEGFTYWLVERRSDQAILGFCGLGRVDAPDSGAMLGQAEIGWRFAESAWGQGYATEAASACLRHGVDNLGMAKIHALISAENHASHALAARIGMTRRPDSDFIDTRLSPAIHRMTVFSHTT